MKFVGITLTALILVSSVVALSFGPFPSSALEDPVFYNELGYLLAEEGNLAEAQNAFLQAVALDSGYENARKNLYVTAFQNGDFETAIYHSRHLMDVHGTAQYHFDYAQSLVAWSRDDDSVLEEALFHLEEAGDYPHAAENAAIIRNVLG